MKILVLGGGAQGRVIASDLSAALPRATITVADLRRPALPERPNLVWVEADCAESGAIERLLGEHDLGVGALPSHLGIGAMKAAIAARRNLVDVSFCAQDPLILDPTARAAGVTIIPDCGLAPGLSNLLLGRTVPRRGIPRAVRIMVGGVAQDAAQPYGYVVTWSLDDLMEEYTRPARIVREGRETSVPVFSGLERVTVAGVGEMEAFYSDGLRTLIRTMPRVRDMGEMTLRWPGHVAAIRPLLAAGTLREELARSCTLDPPLDLVALVVRAWWDAGGEEVTMVDRYHAATGLTAMARTTALTTAAVARLAAEGGLGGSGVRPLEQLALDSQASKFVLEIMNGHGIKFSRREITLPPPGG